MADGQVVFEISADPKNIDSALSGVTQTIESEGRKWEKNTKESTDGMADSFDTMSGKASAAITNLTGKVINLATKGINKMMDYSDAVDKGSKSMGISAKAYQELDYAMGMSGANIETLTRGVGNLNSALNGTASNEVKNALSSLGFSDSDLASMSSMEELLDGVLYRIAGLDGQAARANIANSLFGVGAGSQLAAFLSEGETGIKALRQQAEDLGIVQTDEAISQAVKTKDSIDTLNQTLNAVLMQAIIPLLQLIQSLVDFATPFLPIVTDIMNAMMDLLDPIFKLAGIDREGRERQESIATHKKEATSQAVGGEDLYTTLLGIFGTGSADERAAVEKYLVQNYGLRKENYEGKMGAEGVIGELYSQMYHTTVNGTKLSDNVDYEYSLNRLKAYLADLEPVVKPEVDTQKIQEQIDGQTYTVTVNPTLGYFGGGEYGSHANGLDYVPYDGYFSILHQGERIQTAAEADLSRRYGNQAPSPDLTGAVRAGMGNMQIIWRGRVVADVLSEQQGDSFRALERSGWRS